MHKTLQIHLLLIFAVILSACNTSVPTSETSAKQIVTFAAPEELELIYQPLIEKFNEQNPEFLVRFIMLPPPDGTPDEMLSATVRAADTAVIEYLGRNEIERKYLTDLEPFIQMDASFRRDDFLPGRLEAFAKNGHSYLIPENLQVPVLFYNKQLWQAAGLPPPGAVMQWQDLQAAARVLAQKQGTTIERYGLFDSEAGQLAFLAELHERNVQPFDHSPQDLTFAIPAYREALDQVKRDVDAGTIYVQTAETPDYTSLITNQKIAIWPPNMLGSTVLPFDVGILPMPPVPVPFYGTSSSFRGYVMSSGTTKPEQAWRWLSFLSRQTIPLPTGAHPAEFEMPVRKSLLQTSTYLSSLPRDQQELLRAIIQQPLSSIPIALHSTDIYYALGVAVDEVATLHKPVEQALATASERLGERIAANTQQPPAPVSIVVATPEPEYDPSVTTVINVAAGGYATEQFRQLIRSFQTEAPEIQINIVKRDYNPFTLVQSSEVGSIDCFVNLAFPEAANAAAVKDIQPLVDADRAFSSSDYPPALLHPYRQGSRLLGLPLATYYRVLSYNKTMFEEQGIAFPSQEWSMETFLQTAEQMKRTNAGEVRYGFAGAYPQDLFFFFDRFQVVPVSTNAGKTTIQYTSPAFQQAVAYYIELLKKASPDQRFNNTNSNGTDHINRIAEGHVAMWLGSGGITGMPNLPFDTAITAPVFGGVGVGDNVRSIGMFVSATSSHPEACWKFIRHVSKGWLGIPGTFPPRIAQLDSPEYTGGASAQEIQVAQQYHAALRKQASIDTLPTTAWQSSTDFYWLYRAIDQALQGKDLTQELQQAQALTERYNECIQRGTLAPTCATTVDPEYKR